VDTALVLFGDRGLLEGDVPLMPAYCDDKLGASQENFINSFLRRTLHKREKTDDLMRLKTSSTASSQAMLEGGTHRVGTAEVLSLARS